MPTRSVVLRLVAALATAGMAAPSRATLGGPAESVAADQAALAAARGTADVRAAYRVERLVSRARTVREYVSPSGVVFAVAWEGASPPDLAVVLGTYAAPVRRAADEQPPTRGRRSRHVEGGGAILETWGHMRALRGRAWVPALVPAGVNVDDIR